MENPTISIIVPVYNVEKYLDRCIQSILNQTFKDFELILVDDGSTDNSGFICEKYKEMDNRIVVIHKENGGLSSARNTGLDIAIGKYIGFVDSDDYINENMYEILYNEAIKNNSDVVVSDFEKVCENKEHINYKLDKYEIENYNNIEALNQLFESKNVIFIVAWNKLYKRQIFNNLRYEEGKIYEDEFIIHKILYESKITTFIDLKLYYYVQRENSITQSKFSVKNLMAIEAMEDRIQFFKKMKKIDLMQKSEVLYIGVFFRSYNKVKENLSEYKKEFKKYKKYFNRNIFNFLENPLFGYKAKIIFLIFSVSPYIYDKYIDSKK